jgi:predicted dehydrogenase
MHTLAFLDPGHFHAALTLGERHAGVHDDIAVYAPPGRELDDFLALVEAFNRRAERPTAWRPVVRAGDRSLERLIADRPGDAVILAGRNDRKATNIRRLHDAGFHVLADKPWLAGPDGLDDLRHSLAGGSLVAEIMTGRHEITGILLAKLAADREILGGLDDETAGEPAIRISGVHHLEKMVNGRPLRRPPWYFDVRVQGDGIADIPTHMVDQAQRLVRASLPPEATGPLPAPTLVTARTWATTVPRALFARVTGISEFPAEVGGAVAGSALSYECNAELCFRIGAATVALDSRWDLTAPAGGGDTSRTVVRGRRAELRLEQSAATDFRRRLSVLPLREPDRVRAGLARSVAACQDVHPGLALAEAGTGWELRLPRALDSGHETHFSRVLADFLARIDGGGLPPHVAADTGAKYALLARAATAARGLVAGAPR